MTAVLPVRVDNRSVMAIAVPMTLAHLSTPLLGLANTVVIGQLDNDAFLGAVAVSAVLFDFLFWAFGFLRMGTAGLTAQALGARDAQEQRALLIRALLLAGLIGVALIALQALIAALSIPLFGGSAEVTAAARIYFDIRIWSAPLALANYALLGWLVGLGRANTGLLLQILMTGINIVLCVVFSLSWGWAVAGVAWASLIAEAVTMVAGLAVAALWFRGRVGVPRAVIFSRAKMIGMVALNRDIMLRNIMLLIAWSFFARQGALAGDTILAANAVLNNLFAVGGYFLDGIATAAEQLCGRAVGASNRPAFIKAVRLSIVWNLSMAAMISLLFYAAGDIFIDAMVKSAGVRAEARIYLVYAALSPLVGALAFTFDGVYIGAAWNGAMRNLMAAALMVYFGAWWILRPLENHGTWLAILTFLSVRGLTQWLTYRALIRRPLRRG